MPQRKCSQKRLRVDKKRTLANSRIKADLKKTLKGLKALIAQGKTDEAAVQINVAYSKLDRAVSKGLLHRNTAARRKSGLAVMLRKKA